MKHSHLFSKKVKSMELLFELVFITVSRNFTFLSNREIYNLIFEGKCYPRCKHRYRKWMYALRNDSTSKPENPQWLEIPNVTHIHRNNVLITGIDICILFRVYYWQLKFIYSKQCLFIQFTKPMIRLMWKPN